MATSRRFPAKGHRKRLVIGMPEAGKKNLILGQLVKSLRRPRLCSLKGAAASAETLTSKLS